ncbi:hypothetical protein C3404_25210 [Citrobacter freundii complex sp. CFNIH11]|nr:hypothetical protein CFA70_09405 [Citrobacter freundii]OYQ94775.1 hypothetical protein B9P86_23065 [Citrobacter freundii]POV58620.1 hypothetical protein C3404_25210 [Citrobacter freundii complex sp. CFNIH11]
MRVGEFLILARTQEVEGQEKREILPNLHLSAKNRIIPDDITALKQFISALSFFGLFVPNVEIWLAGVILS